MIPLLSSHHNSLPSIKPRSMAIETIPACSPRLVMACSITSLARVISLVSIVAKRMAMGSLLVGSQTTHILKPNTVTLIFFTLPLRLLSSGAFSFVTLPRPLHFSLDSRSDASSNTLILRGKKEWAASIEITLLKTRSRVLPAIATIKDAINSGQTGPRIPVLSLSSQSVADLSRLHLLTPSLISRPLNPTRCISD